MRQRLMTWVWVSLVLLVIMVAGMLLLAKTLSHYVPAYRGQVEAMLAQRLGQPVHVEQLGLRWRGMAPAVRLLDVHIGPEQAARVLKLDEIDIDIALLPSLWHRSLIPRGIRIFGAAISIDKMPDGTWFIGDIKLPKTQNEETPSERLRLIGDLLKQVRSLELEQSQLILNLHRADLPPQRIHGVEIRIDSDGAHHQVSLDTGQAGSIAERLLLTLDAWGELARPSTLNARVRLHAQAIKPGKMLHTLAPTLDLNHALISFDSHWIWRDQALQQGAVEWQSRDLRLAPKLDAHQVRIDRFNGTFQWQSAGTKGWRLTGKQIELSRDGSPWSPTSFAMTWQATDKEPHRLNLTADYLKLQDVRDMLMAVPAQYLERIKPWLAWEPSGEVRNLQLTYPLKPLTQDVAGWQLAATFKGLGWHSQDERLPSVQGLDGQVTQDDGQGKAVLNANKVLLKYPKLFEQSWPALNLSTQLNWHRDAQGLSVNLSALQARNEDMKLAGRASMRLAQAATPEVDIQADLQDGRVAAVGRYLPRLGLPPQVARWLEQSLQGGRVNHAQVILRGPLMHFPFDHGEGEFKVTAKVEDGDLCFDPQWPKLQGMNADLAFQGRSMRIDVQGGTTAGARILAAQAVLPDMTHPDLKISGRAEADAAAGITYLRATPLAKNADKFLAELKASGPTQLDLQLDLPLHDLKHTQVRGHTSWQDARIVLPGFPVEFEHIQGALNFDEHHFESPGLQAYLDGYPVQVKVAPITLPKVEGMLPVKITAQGKITGRTLTQKLHIFSNRVFSGIADWNAVVELGGNNSGWRVNSNLQGMAVNLPAGYAKKASQSLPLEVASEAGEGLILRIRYGQNFQTLLAFGDQEGVERGDLYFGKGVAVLPVGAGLRIRGALDNIAVQDIQQVFNQTSTSEKAADADAGMALTLPDWLGAMDLHVGELQVLGLHLHDVALSLPEQTYRRLWIDSDLVRGTAEPFKNGKSGWRVQLDYLNIPQMPQDDLSPAAGKMSPLTSIHPRDLPPVDLHVDRLNYVSWRLGAVNMSLRPANDEMHINNLQMQMPGMMLQGRGGWKEQAGQHVSTLQLKLSANDMGKAFEFIGSPKLMDAKQAELEGSLEWPSAPWQVHLRDIQGVMGLKLKDGQIYVAEVNPRSGPIMLLFSLYALPSRLSLDFGSVFSRSMTFTSISGDFNVLNGNVYTDDLKLTGPVADIKVAGRTGLIDQDFNQQIEVIPSLSVAAALAGTAAGGPLVGAAALLGQQLLKRPLGRLIELDYQLSGSWKQPELKRTAGPFNLPSISWPAKKSYTLR